MLRPCATVAQQLRWNYGKLCVFFVKNDVIAVVYGNKLFPALISTLLFTHAVEFKPMPFQVVAKLGRDLFLQGLNLGIDKFDYLA